MKWHTQMPEHNVIWVTGSKRVNSGWSIHEVSLSTSRSRIWAAASRYISVMRCARRRRGWKGVRTTHASSSSAAVITNGGTMTAGEADVNSNIKFQSASTMSTLPGKGEALEAVWHDQIPQKCQKTIISLRSTYSTGCVRLKRSFAAVLIASIQQEKEDVQGWRLGVRLVSVSVWSPLCWLLGCPPGAGEQSAFWHFTLAQQSRPVWPWARLHSQLLPVLLLLLLGQSWIFSCDESNSLRHATVQTDSVSCVCLSAVWAPEDRNKWMFYRMLIH